VLEGKLLQFQNLQDYKELSKHYEMLEQIKTNWDSFLVGELSLADLKLLIQMKERIVDDKNDKDFHVLQLLNLTKAAALKFKHAYNKLKLADHPVKLFLSESQVLGKNSFTINLVKKEGKLKAEEI